MSMDWYEPEVRALEKTRLGVPHPVVFYGSSSIRLWPRLDSSEVINRGFGGSTLEACVYFFERLVVPLRPRSLVVYAGDNDLGDGRSPEQVLGYFKQLAGRIEQHLPGVPFGYISVKPSLARVGILDRIYRANELIEREIGRHPSAYFIPVAGYMVDAAGLPRQELFLADGLHMSLAGYRLWEQLLATYHNQIFTPFSVGCNKNDLILNDGESGVQKVVQPPSKS